MFSLPASMKKIRSKMKALEWTQHFPHYKPMGAICCHGNQFPILPGPKPNAINPPPNDASDKIWLRLAHLLRRYSRLNMFTDPRTDGRTHARTPDRPVYYKLTFEPLAQVS